MPGPNTFQASTGKPEHRCPLCRILQPDRFPAFYFLRIGGNLPGCRVNTLDRINCGITAQVKNNTAASGIGDIPKSFFAQSPLTCFLIFHINGFHCGSLLQKPVVPDRGDAGK